LIEEQTLEFPIMKFMACLPSPLEADVRKCFYYLNFAPKSFFETALLVLTNPMGRTSALRSFE
jgi:hypothetical protein